VNNTLLADNVSLPLNPPAVPRWKRALDVALIVLAAPLLLVVGGAMALLIKCVSPGPIFFRQERVGHLGRRFMIFKFRTMHVNAETGTHQNHLASLVNSNAPMVKMDAKGDPRIIPLGKWIRASGLDELPQLLNVLFGEMSLVGPRPCLPYEAANFQDWQRERFTTLPGLTGLWQVSGKNRTTFTEMMNFDIEYARTKSLALDLQIMVSTLPALLVQVVEIYQRRQQQAQSVVQSANRAGNSARGSRRSAQRETGFSLRDLSPVSRAI
jgi:lipopolysaccharide/colanic/teichoic acid biosynthesis glycosyltransferase